MVGHGTRFSAHQQFLRLWLRPRRRQDPIPTLSNNFILHDLTDAKMKFLKVGRVAIITRGRYAGKKVRNPTSIV